MPRLFVGFFRHFRVPVGTATADMKPGNAYPSHRASLLFKPPGGAGLSNISKFIIYLLRNEHSGGKTHAGYMRFDQCMLTGFWAHQ